MQDEPHDGFLECETLNHCSDAFPIMLSANTDLLSDPIETKALSYILIGILLIQHPLPI